MARRRTAQHRSGPTHSPQSVTARQPTGGAPTSSCAGRDRCALRRAWHPRTRRDRRARVPKRIRSVGRGHARALATVRAQEHAAVARAGAPIDRSATCRAAANPRQTPATRRSRTKRLSLNASAMSSTSAVAVTSEGRELGATRGGQDPYAHQETALVGQRYRSGGRPRSWFDAGVLPFPRGFSLLS